jgi:hypothetical protein
MIVGELVTSALGHKPDVLARPIQVGSSPGNGHCSASACRPEFVAADSADIMATVRLVTDRLAVRSAAINLIFA